MVWEVAGEREVRAEMSRRRELPSCLPASFSSGNCLGLGTVTVNHSSGINDLAFFFFFSFFPN